MSKLLPCPFCGGKPDAVENLCTDSGRIDQIGKWAWIECGCGVRGPDVRANCGNLEGWQDDAAAEWNRRAPATVTREAPMFMHEDLCVMLSRTLRIEWISDDNAVISGRTIEQAADAILALLSRGIAS